MSDLPFEVPWQDIAPATLEALLEEFATRDGTDYGRVEASLADKVAQLRGQLQRGEVLVVFDPLAEAVNLLGRREFRERLRQLSAED